MTNSVHRHRKLSTQEADAIRSDPRWVRVEELCSRVMEFLINVASDELAVFGMGEARVHNGAAQQVARMIARKNAPDLASLQDVCARWGSLAIAKDESAPILGPCRSLNAIDRVLVRNSGRAYVEPYFYWLVAGAVFGVLSENFGGTFAVSVEDGSLCLVGPSRVIPFEKLFRRAVARKSAGKTGLTSAFGEWLSG